MRNTPISTCLCQVKCLKVLEYAPHWVFMPWKVVKESFFKVAEYAYHNVLAPRKVVLKLRNTHITTCSCQGKCLKVAKYTHHYVFTLSNVVS